ncbi:bifunctional cobalt-precorrin-7 (C(5))-methyltransferase/cobalt-precorrin-6B (C(15))-methyltransferase [Rhodocyclaceae bacterium]
MNKPPCAIVGILDDGWAGLGEAARRRLAGADFLLGTDRTLDLVRPHLAPATKTRALDGALAQTPDWIKAAQAGGKSVVVLATGDPLYHGIARRLINQLGAEGVEVLPAPSTLQLACARLKRPWQDAVLVSAHGVDGGEWQPGAPPTHPLMPLLHAAARGAPRIVCLTAPANGPARIARALIAAGWGEEFRLSVAAHLLLPDEALWVDLPLVAAAAMDFPDPNVVVLERTSAVLSAPTFGCADADYLQRQPEKGLITKLEVRAVSLARLGLRADSIVWDIGAGSGALGIEAARLASDGHVFAIEKNAADAANARANALRLRAINYTLVEGRAPKHLDTWPDPDAVFIGGSGGELAALIRLVLARLKPDGRLVMNFVTLENLATAMATLKASAAAWEVVQLQASRSQPILDLHRLAAQNPVWIITASKETPCPVTAN